MRKLLLVTVLFATAALPAAAQMSKQVMVQMGSPEDHELAAIQAASSSQQKLALLDKFAAAHTSGDMALMAANLYVSLYSSMRKYAMAYKSGDKALALDPYNLDVAVELVRDAQLQSDAAKMVGYGVRVGQMVADYKKLAAPEGISADQWEMQKKQTLASVEPQVNWVVSAVYAAISHERTSSARTAQLDRMAKAFPESSYARRNK